MDKKIKFYFVWHWNKKTSEELKGAFAAFDSLIYAISLLSRNPQLEVRILAVSDSNKGDYKSKEQGIDYIFFPGQAELIQFISQNAPDIALINHHSQQYKDFAKKISELPSKKIIYYSSPIIYKNPFKQYVTKYHLLFDWHIVHHQYQKDQLNRKFRIPATKIIIAPKTADLALFKPIPMGKKWDCIYPCRGKENSWKRPELAIEACRLAEKTLCMPGAKLKKSYPWVTTFDKWQTPEELQTLYNQSRSFLITSDYKEMGPRVIMEAAACNLPIVCCSDSAANVSHVSKLGGFIARPNVKDIAEKVKLAVRTKVNYRPELERSGLTFDLIYKKLLEILNTF